MEAISEDVEEDVRVTLALSLIATAASLQDMPEEVSDHLKK